MKTITPTPSIETPAQPRICGTCAHCLDQPPQPDRPFDNWHIDTFAKCAELQKSDDRVVQKTWVAKKGTCYFLSTQSRWQAQAAAPAQGAAA